MQHATPWRRVPSACSPAAPALPGCSLREHRVERARHALDLVVGERRIARDRQRLGPQPVGLRKAVEPARAMGRAEHGPPRRHATLAKHLSDGHGIAIEADYEAVIYVSGPRVDGQPRLDTGEHRAVARGDGAAARDEGIEA